jgi:hypothetical protein
MQDPTKFTQIEIFGLKTSHLATLETKRNVNKQHFLRSLKMCLRRQICQAQWTVEADLLY